MSIPAVCLSAGVGARDPFRCELGPDVAAALSAARASDTPMVYVVRHDDLSSVWLDADIVVDRGAKHPAKGLASLLLGHDRIPMIRGGYTSCGQLLRSIRTLLDHAARRDDQNIFVIGAEPTIFAELWDRAGAGSAVATELPFREHEPTTSGGSPPGAAATASSALAELLPELPVPESVRTAFVGTSLEAQLVRQLILRAAKQDGPVLLLGDTGTGKEVVARLIHDQSRRHLGSFVPVNCGAIPRELLESELFGARKGSHSEAKTDKLGLWRMADRGTLFLDEIAELSIHHQVKILRSLETGKIRPLGETREIEVDTRVLAATNRDLFSMVQSGEFREDLYYRLRAFTIRTPALRDHPEDIPLLATHFWRAITRSEKAELPPDVLQELRAHGWPGNAREIKLLLSNLFGLFGEDGLTVRHLRAILEFEGQARAEMAKPPPPGEIGAHRVQCLQHLRRVDEVLRSAKVALRPVISGGRPNASTVERILREIRDRANELELLCMRPLLFHGESAFLAVHRLKGKLVRFSRLLEGDAGEARSHWTADLAEEFQQALSTIFREVDRLMRES